jgi:hypothetical protein
MDKRLTGVAKSYGLRLVFHCFTFKRSIIATWKRFLKGCCFIVRFNQGGPTMKYASLLIFILLACSKHSDPGFSSVAGNWSYTSPDTEVTVTFTLAKNSSGGLDIQSQTIKINGVQYIAAAQITASSLTSIQKIHINANDPLATYAYDVEFDNCSVSTDFKTITAATGYYTWPNTTAHNLTSVKVSRM